MKIRTAEDIAAYCEESARVIRCVAEACTPEVMDAARRLAEAVRSGQKILLCGNGGSAADAQHWAAEFVSTLTRDFERPAIAALALTTDTSFLTAYANDFGFAGVFSRQVEALGRPGDVLIVISTSGNSENLRHAVTAAANRGISSIGVLGTGGGSLAAMVDFPIVVPSSRTGHVQEAHAVLIHLLCSLVEQEVFGVADPAVGGPVEVI